jgi:hypothetical protein
MMGVALRCFALTDRLDGLVSKSFWLRWCAYDVRISAVNLEDSISIFERLLTSQTAAAQSIDQVCTAAAHIASITPHRTTSHHTTPHRTAPHRTTAQHSTAFRSTK